MSVTIHQKDVRFVLSGTKQQVLKGIIVETVDVEQNLNLGGQKIHNVSLKVRNYNYNTNENLFKYFEKDAKFDICVKLDVGGQKNMYTIIRKARIATVRMNQGVASTIVVEEGKLVADNYELSENAMLPSHTPFIFR